MLTILDRLHSPGISLRQRAGPPETRALGGFLILALALVAVLMPPVPAAAYGTGDPAEDGKVYILMHDNAFRPAVVRVQPGTTVVWINEGRAPHTVTADDGRFASDLLQRGERFEYTFAEAGRYLYYCEPHGAAGGHGMAGMVLVGDAAAETTAPPPPQPPTSAGPPRTWKVPADAPTIQAAVDLAAPGDLILVAPGVYREAVVVMTPGITIRGLDRNQVILDGDFQLDNGIKVLAADNVVIENMTARHYTLNGFFWIGVKGYRGSYLTAYNNGDYGLYAFDSVYGQFDHSYASGHPDSGFYIGQCKPCHAVITDVVAEHNALGYSGTNAGGDLTIMNSVWRHNMAGIVPNTLDTERLAPQAGTRIVQNEVYENNNAQAPFHKLQYPSFGVGILITGGNDNLIEGNRVTDHVNYGILIAPNMDRNFWTAGGNVVRQNTVRRSGRADLALGAPAGPGNCFSGNDATTSHPVRGLGLYGCDSPLTRLGGGDPAVTLHLVARFAKAGHGRVEPNDWRTQPVPPSQPTMPDPLAPPAPAWPPPAAATAPLSVSAPPPVEGPRTAGSLSLMGVAAVAPMWSFFLGLYLYALPFVLYAAWVSLAVWDLVRRDDLTTSRKVGWLAATLLVPGLGPVAYYALGGSPIPRGLRLALVAGGPAAYLALAAMALLFGLGA